MSLLSVAWNLETTLELGEANIYPPDERNRRGRKEQQLVGPEACDQFCATKSLPDL